jgi:signal recognition particle subunit SRP54
MLNNLSQKFQGIFARLSGKYQLTEKNISQAVQEVRDAFLEADVSYPVVKALIDNIKEKALGKKVLGAIKPGQQFIKAVHDELVAFMGGEEAPLNLSQEPSFFLVCGLQGSGKTTFSAKLARFLKKKGDVQRPLLIACDLQRPAAVEQLQILGSQIGVPVFSIAGEKDPRVVAKKGAEHARAQKHDLVIVDTAGRLHIDAELMDELREMKNFLKPTETLLVANATLGQDAVRTADTFQKELGITGAVLTMLDGNTRGGAALSIRHVTGKPLKFEGVGEKVEDLQLFNPRSMADRILGMGDTINLVRKAEEHMDAKTVEDMEKKILDASFTYEDLVKQFQMVKKMGPLKGLLGMLPGMGGMNLGDLDEKKFYRLEAMILSMTAEERRGRVELSMPRRKRIARGSGTDLDDVNRLVKMYGQAKEFFKKGPNMKHLQKMMGG